MKRRFRLDTYNGRFRIFADDLPMITFNQIDFAALYSFKDDHNLYCIDIQFKNGTKLETSFKTKDVWTEVLKLLATI